MQEDSGIQESNPPLNFALNTVQHSFATIASLGCLKGQKFRKTFKLVIKIEMNETNDKSSESQYSPFSGWGGSGWGATLVLLAILLGMMTGCRSTKKIEKGMAVPSHKDTVKIVTIATPPEDLKADSLKFIRQTIGQLAKNHIDFRTFSGKVKIYYEGSDGSPIEVNATIHIKKDSLIWVSVNVALGFEGFRVLITPDSVKILDKLKKIARLRSVSFLQEAIHLPVDFKTLQDLLIGNPVYLDTSNIIYYKNEPVGGLSLMSIGPLFKNYLTLNPGDNTLRHSKLDETDPMKVLSCDVTYGDYDQKEGPSFSTYRKISVVEKSKTDIELTYKQYKFNEALSFSFTIPKNYKRK
jgi:Domain of unknown function (DUF4292)